MKKVINEGLENYELLKEHETKGKTKRVCEELFLEEPKFEVFKTKPQKEENSVCYEVAEYEGDKKLYAEYVVLNYESEDDVVDIIRKKEGCFPYNTISIIWNAL